MVCPCLGDIQTAHFGGMVFQRLYDGKQWFYYIWDALNMEWEPCEAPSSRYILRQFNS